MSSLLDPEDKGSGRFEGSKIACVVDYVWTQVSRSMI